MNHCVRIEAWRNVSERERECTRARLCVREKEKLVAFRYLANIGQILTSQVYTFCRATKSASFYLFINCFRVLASGKRGRARNCVNPCPFFSFPSLLFFFFFIFSPFHNRMFTTVCCIRLQLESSKRARHSLKIKFRELSEFVPSELY